PPGTGASPASVRISKRCRTWWPTHRPICSPESRTGKVKRSFARRCSSQTITLTTWDSSSCCDAFSLSGRVRKLRPVSRLVRLGEHHASLGRLARDHALAGFLRALKGDAAKGGFGLCGDLILGLARAVPVSPQEAAGLFDFLLEFVVGVDFEAIGIAKLLGPF